MNSHIASTVLMVSPDKFGFNIETAPTNLFQIGRKDLSPENITKNAMDEFMNAVKTLRENDTDVIILPSRKDFATPDAIFPNNWVSHHKDGTLIIYPMLAQNRRAERQTEALKNLLQEYKITTTLIDFSKDEKYGRYLEGTGSLILDREHKVAFAMESPRTNEEEFRLWCDTMNYDGVFFHAYDKKKIPIFVTNNMLALGYNYAVICFEAIEDSNEKIFVREQLEKLQKEIIEISLEQVFAYCGNVVQLQTKKGEKILFLSQQAYDAFTKEQKNIIGKYTRLVPVNLDVIEAVGGGSARAMVVEIFP